MNTMIKRAARFAAFVLVLSAAGCSMDDIVGTARTPLCTRTISDDGFGGREEVCAEELVDGEVLEDGKADD